tara:strand:- start:278 stop:856 length:579 start_codon:yes stop_codon:yes gene_type:complete
MPEKITKQEAKIEQTIRAVRKAKELLMEQDLNTLPYDGLGKTVKVKKPKAVKADKITNETQPKEGYGLAGEVFGKATDSKEHMLEEIQNRWADIKSQLDTSITKSSLVQLIGFLENYSPISEHEQSVNNEDRVGKAISNDGVEHLNTKIRELMQKVHAMDNPTKEDLTNIHHELEKLKRIITQYDKMESFVG